MKENQQDNQWLDEVREQMQDFEAPIPADGWERVSTSLSPIKKPAIGKRWMGIAASVLLCAMIGGGNYFFGHEPDTATEQAESAVNHQMYEQMTASLQHEEKQDELQPTISRNISTHKKQIEPDIQSKELEPIIEETIHTEEYEAATPQVDDNTFVVTDSIIPSPSHEEEKVLLAMNEVCGSTKEDAGWSFGLHFAGHGSLQEGDLAFNQGTMGDPTHNGNTGTNAPVEPDYIIDSYRHASWSFGLSVGRKINTKTTLETGLVFTLLTSDVKMKNAGIKDQEIQYLGVPLKLNYLIAGNQQCQFYTSGGLMLEHTMSATRGNQKLDIKSWQWSVALSAGGQLRVTPHLYLYLEPGVNWYFDTDAFAPSIRTESPVFFNLRGGLRFSY